MFMEDEVDFFNAGRGSALCRDGAIEMSAALMRGSDRAAGAVAGVTRKGWRRQRRPAAGAASWLGRRKFGFYNQQGQFVVQPGPFDIWVGDSSVGGMHAMFNVR